MNILKVDYSSPNAAEEFTRSLKETGFGIIHNHPIDFDKIKHVYDEWENFFKGDDKHRYLFEEETQDGYFPFLSESAKDYDAKDLKEFYHVYPWGRFPESLSNDTQELYGEMNQLASTLLSWVEANTPEPIRKRFSMPLPEMLEGTRRTLLRVIYYPPIEQEIEPGQVRAAAHEDINLLTILPAATQKGLQVMQKNGEWLDVECEGDTLIINVGDMLQLASDYYYPSTTHRVVNPDSTSSHLARLSMPLFLHPEDTVVLGEGKSANQYRIERLRELGLVA